MGWFDSDVLEFNTANLSRQAQVIRGIATDLTDAQRRLKEDVDLLRSDWQTGAGDKFFEQYDTEWVEKLNGYVDLLDDLIKALDYAAQQYDPVATEYANIL